MPFRLLPNSDPTRVAALDAVALKAATIAAAERPYPAALQTQLDTLRPQFKTEVGDVGAALTRQTAVTSDFETDFLALQTLVSHFIQVFNLAIARGVFPRTDRANYGLDVNSQSLPPLTTHADVIAWADRLILGEAKRLAASPSARPMINPSIGEVETALGNFRDAISSQTAAKDAYDTEQEEVAALRPAVDKLIRDLWDHIEFTYREQDGPSRRRRCREWGIVYITRPGETPDPEDGTLENPPTPNL